MAIGRGYSMGNVRFLIVFLGLFGIAQPFATASPFYRETFRLCPSPETSSSNANEFAAWKAFKNDSPIGKIGFLKITRPGSPDHPAAYNSFPKGPDDGGAFWSKAALGLTIFTDEINFDVGNLSQIEYQQRLDGYDRNAKIRDGTQLILLIGDTWYISDQTVRQNVGGFWESVVWAPYKLTYGTTPNVSGRGPKRPKNFGVSLPQSGTVNAFGVYLPAATDRVRIDNFTVSDSLPELRTPGDQGSIDQCQDPGPQNPFPDGETRGVFCQVPAAHALGKISASPDARKRLLAGVKGKSLIAARDRAILELLLSNHLRLDSLVNISVFDYYSVGSLQVLNTAGISRRTVPLRSRVKKLIDQYMLLAGLGKHGALPLFQSIDKRNGAITHAALCTEDLKKIVTRRARAARLKGQYKIGR